MESSSWKPTVVIGIDFGMTCTAVAYSTAPEWARPICVQNWPGKHHSSQLANKVNTQVAYDDNEKMVSWGLQCGWDDVPTAIEKEFKLYLDPAFGDAFHDRPTHDRAVRGYKDYMASLHKYLDSFFDQAIPNWAQRNVEFLFSIPTTWTSPHLTSKLEEWLGEAGFANYYNRKIRISQTEAEAAAVYAAKQSFTAGDIIMVADAGGATTDINILEIKEHSYQRTQLIGLNKAEGINVGSILINGHAKQLITQHLHALNVSGDDDNIQWLAEDMLKENNFDAMKCAFDGSPTQMSTIMTIPPERLPAALRGVPQKIKITGAELRTFFDRQIETMFESIHHQIRDLMREKPNVTVKFIVLSGGLGSSKYVRSRLEARFSNITVLCAFEPQLAVAKGLVMDRTQTLSRGLAVYTGRCSRVSYGVLTRVPYDKVAHRGARVTKDVFDNKLWAEDQIDWLIREGEAVPDDGLTRPYTLKIAKGEELELIEAQFYMSRSPANGLPKDLRGKDVSKVCTVTAEFSDEYFSGRSSQQFKHKKGRLFSRSHDHWIAEFDLRVLVGSADLRFELISKDGRKLNTNDASIEITWEEAAPSSNKKRFRGLQPATDGKNHISKHSFSF